MASPMLSVPWEKCLLEPIRDRAAEAELKRAVGSGPPWARYFLPAPWVARAMVRLYPEHGLLVDLDYDIADLAALVVSQEASCRFCYAAHRAQLRLQGMNEERVARLEQKLSGGGLAPRAAAVVRFARRMARANPPATPSDLAALSAAGLSPGEAREVAYVIAVMVFLNRISTIAALPTRMLEEVPDRWWARLLRPLLGAILRSTRRRGTAVPALPADTCQRALTASFGGSPVARVVEQVIDEVWQSGALPRRAKALMFAVVAQGLGCRHSAGEMRPLLHEEGMSDSSIDQVLAHLAGPELGSQEVALLAFTRDTIWYEPRQIQQRARVLREQLTAEQFVEAIGVAALGNALCRLTLAVAPPP